MRIDKKKRKESRNNIIIFFFFKNRFDNGLFIEDFWLILFL